MRNRLVLAPILIALLGATGPTERRLTPDHARLSIETGSCRPESALRQEQGRFHLQCTVVTNASTQRKRLSACRIVRAEPEPAHPYPAGVAACFARQVQINAGVADGPVSLAISWRDDPVGEGTRWAIER